MLYYDPHLVKSLPLSSIILIRSAKVVTITFVSVLTLFGSRALPIELAFGVFYVTKRHELIAPVRHLQGSRASFAH